MKHPLITVSIVALATLTACEKSEHDGGEDSVPQESSNGIPARTQPDSQRPSAPVGVIPFKTIGTESEFTDGFEEEIHGYSQLAAFYQRHNLRADRGDVGPAWHQVDFSHQFVIYISRGTTVAKVDAGELVVESIESNGERLLVHVVDAGPAFCPPGTDFTNHFGHVIVVEDYGLPVRYQTLFVDLFCP